MKQYLRIGCIVRTHGVHGAVKLESTTDRIERFRGLSYAYLEKNGNGTYERVNVSDVRLLNDAVSLRISGINSVEDANALRGSFLCVDREHAVKLPENTYFIADLVGCTVEDTDGKSYGTITDVYKLPANDVYVIDGGKIMIPALKRIIHEVFPEENRIVFKAKELQEVILYED